MKSSVISFLIVISVFIPISVFSQVGDDSVRLDLSINQSPARMAMGYVLDSCTSNSFVKVNGYTCNIRKDADGYYIIAPVATDKVYKAILFFAKSGTYFTSGGLLLNKIPYSQFLNTTIEKTCILPMYGMVQGEGRQCLELKDGFSLLDITLKGSTEVTLSSIRIEHPDNQPLAGICTFSYDTGRYTANTKKSVSQVNLNCTAGLGATLTYQGVRFLIPILSGACEDGLLVRICDSNHKMMSFHTNASTWSPGEVIKIEKDYHSEDSLIYFEGFDNFVWGGNPAAGSIGYGYSPSLANPGTTANTQLTGYEEALTTVDSNIPGTGFLQSNTWADVNGKVVATSHTMQESYYRSRCVWDWIHLFRCQEFSGYLGIGTGSTYRGIMQTSAINGIDGLRNVGVSFDIAFPATFNDNVAVQLVNGGFVRKVLIDGIPLDSTLYSQSYQVATSTVVINRNAFKIVSNAQDPKYWQKVTLEVENATNGMSLVIEGATTASGNHAMYVDNIRIDDRGVCEKGQLRILYWNIQNGMWGDQANDYTNFVKWIKKLNPDVCVWCESCSNYSNNGLSSLSHSQRFLPNNYGSYDSQEGWKILAARYGHNYVAQSGRRDNFPQQVTSRYPITTKKKITSTGNTSRPIWHGASIQKISVEGHDLHFITLHNYPFSYAPGLSAEEQPASSAAFEGEAYRVFEMNYILDCTCLDPEYRSQPDWLMMGDFNAICRRDNTYYKYADNDARFQCMDVVTDKTNMVDLVSHAFPNCFLSTTHGSRRIDYFFLSPALMPYLKRVWVLKDEWTCPTFSGVSNFYYPSDHRPILVDLDFSIPSKVDKPVPSASSSLQQSYTPEGTAVPQGYKGIRIKRYKNGTAVKTIE